MSDKITMTNINNERSHAQPMPLINPDGTSAEALCNEWATAYHAVEAALGAASAATLHGRDFQTHPLKAAYSLAAEHHAKRLRMLTLVRDEIEAIVINLHNQKHEREYQDFHQGQAARDKDQ